MNLAIELEALKENLIADSSVDRYVSLSQLGGLNGLIRQGLENKNRKMRMKILKLWAGDAVRAVTGLEMESSKNLTSPMASFLINILLEENSTPWELSQYGKELVRESEKAVLKQMGIEQLEINI